MEMHGTTILAVRRGENVVIAADGQVTLGNTVLKHSATKLRKLYDSNIIAGFAGATADAFTLFERFEIKLKDFSGNLQRSVVELAKEWRTDRVLRKLEAMLLVADRQHTYIITGNGDVLEPEHGAAAIGSGGNFALAAARALVDQTDLPPRKSQKRQWRLRPTSAFTPTIKPFTRNLRANMETERSFTPREIVSELDKYIVGQADAKRSVAIALRNRWRRQRVDPSLRDEIAPKNIILIGSTGVGKTEIARRLAKLADAPFIKVEASKFTEVGYVGRDVESIVRDLMEVSVKLVREEAKERVKVNAEAAAEERILDLLLPKPTYEVSDTTSSDATRDKFRVVC